MFALDLSWLYLIAAAVLAGWLALGCLAVVTLARRRGLTLLAAGLDPRGWLAERLLGIPAWSLLLLWPTVAIGLADALRLAGRVAGR